MARDYIEIGRKIGMVTILSETKVKPQPSGQKPRYVYCLCDCGNKRAIRWQDLKRGRSISCGCHVFTRGGKSKTRIYHTWGAIKKRVKEGYFESHLYFKKGITICAEWENDFFAFEKWANENGYTDKLQIDRIDNSKGYSPDNCRWVDNIVNVNNRDTTHYVVYKGQKEALTILARRLGTFRYLDTIRGRLKRGWDVDLAFDTPIKEGKYRDRFKQ